MYQEFFGIKDLPFENTPDPRFFFESEEHAEAVSRLAYVLREKRACGILTGVYGCGKTMVLHTIRKEFEAEGYRFSIVNNPRLDDIDILRMILHGFTGAEISRQKGDVLMGLEKTIREINSDGKHPVIIIDEAHAIEQPSVFEELRLLLNYHTDTAFLVSLFVVGQPELKKKIETNKQFNQRVSAKFHLDGFGFDETVTYMDFRMRTAGGSIRIFEDKAVSMIYQLSGGIPRWINNICHMSLLAAFSKQERSVTPESVKEALKGLEGG